jgi:hypothetical protein
MYLLTVLQFPDQLLFSFGRAICSKKERIAQKTFDIWIHLYFRELTCWWPPSKGLPYSERMCSWPTYPQLVTTRLKTQAVASSFRKIALFTGPSQTKISRNESLTGLYYDVNLRAICSFFEQIALQKEKSNWSGNCSIVLMTHVSACSKNLPNSK